MKAIQLSLQQAESLAVAYRCSELQRRLLLSFAGSEDVGTALDAAKSEWLPGRAASAVLFCERIVRRSARVEEVPIAGVDRALLLCGARHENRRRAIDEVLAIAGRLSSDDSANVVDQLAASMSEGLSPADLEVATSRLLETDLFEQYEDQFADIFDALEGRRPGMPVEFLRSVAWP